MSSAAVRAKDFGRTERSSYRLGVLDGIARKTEAVRDSQSSCERK